MSVVLQHPINTQYPLKVVFGIPAQQKPITGLPAGKVRLRFRNDAVGRVFVRTASGIEHFRLIDRGDTWGLLKQGENRRFQSSE